MTENLGDAISKAVAAKLDAEFVEKEVEARVEKLVIEAINSALRSYSETGRLIEASVADALRVDRLDLPSYGETVSQMLKAQIEARVADVIAARLAEDMDELLKLAPKEVKLSEIAKEMLQQHKDDGAYGEVISVLVDHTEYGSAWLYLDEDHAYDLPNKYKCAHRLLLSQDGTISSATLAGRNTKETRHVGRAYGLEQKLRAYVACGTVIVLDEHDVVISVGDY